MFKKGSKPLSISLSDGVATIRDAVLLIVSSGVAYIGDTYFGGFDPELQFSIGIVVFAVLKFGWKFVTNTERESTL